MLEDLDINKVYISLHPHIVQTIPITINLSPNIKNPYHRRQHLAWPCAGVAGWRISPGRTSSLGLCHIVAKWANATGADQCRMLEGLARFELCRFLVISIWSKVCVWININQGRIWRGCGYSLLDLSWRMWVTPSPERLVLAIDMKNWPC